MAAIIFQGLIPGIVEANVVGLLTSIDMEHNQLFGSTKVDVYFSISPGWVKLQSIQQASACC